MAICKLPLAAPLPCHIRFTVKAVKKHRHSTDGEREHLLTETRNLASCMPLALSPTIKRSQSLTLPSIPKTSNILSMDRLPRPRTTRNAGGHSKNPVNDARRRADTNSPTPNHQRTPLTAASSDFRGSLAEVAAKASRFTSLVDRRSGHPRAIAPPSGIRHNRDSGDEHDVTTRYARPRMHLFRTTPVPSESTSCDLERPIGPGQLLPYTLQQEAVYSSTESLSLPPELPPRLMKVMAHLPLLDIPSLRKRHPFTPVQEFRNHQKSQCRVYLVQTNRPELTVVLKGCHMVDPWPQFPCHKL